jgi:uncharacterized protein (DUF433 family)
MIIIHCPTICNKQQGVAFSFFLGICWQSWERRTMSERVSVKPDVCNGRPVVRGTRITVQTVLEFLAAGDSIEDVLEEYPKLTRADVQACLDYASRVMGNHFSVVRAA